MFAVAHLSLLLGKVQRVLVLGPASTVIEAGLRAKFNAYLYGAEGLRLRDKLPARLRHKVIRLLNCNDPIEDGSIIIENITAIYNRERNSIGDTLFQKTDEVLVLSDEVHHAYTHLSFGAGGIGYAYEKDDKGKDVCDERLWMKFLREEEKIRRHIGFTGTPYNANDYFPDVLFNYSIKTATDEKVVKKINPILKIETGEGDDDLTPRQRYEHILQTHFANKEKFSYSDPDGRPTIKPITIFIHPTQAAAKRNTDQFVKVLAEMMKEREPHLAEAGSSVLEQAAREQVICVVSDASSAEYQQKLDQIEEIDAARVGGKVEFIFAVNKLSEGWDVDNVFQIVPSEEKVFNSKLLISQVLGRGLRMPRRSLTLDDLHRNYPTVAVTNHVNFSGHIRELLDEVTECELRLVSGVLLGEENKRRKHHFCLFNLEYMPHERKETKNPDEQDQSQRIRELILTPFSGKLDVKVTYAEGVKRFLLGRDFFTVDEIVLDIERIFKNRDYERRHFDFGDGVVLDHVPGQVEIEQIILAAMARNGIKGDRLSRENKQQVELFFYQSLPRGNKKLIRERIEGAVVAVNTKEMPQSSARAGRLEHTLSVFVSEDNKSELDEQSSFVLVELCQNQQQTIAEFIHPSVRKLSYGRHLYCVNTSLFKTPQSLVIVNHEPEREFVLQLIKHSRLVSSWIKSPDSGFYSLDYEYWRKGKDRVLRSFNPDFFIRISIGDYLLTCSNLDSTWKGRLRYLQDKGIDELVLVVEIKGDEDKEEVTLAKEQYGSEHFALLNRRMPDINDIDLPEDCRSNVMQRYIFYLLRPVQYGNWFLKLEKGAFISDLELQK